VATEEDLNHAIGCLATIFPQFVAKELAALLDGITASVQGFSDPLTAITELNLDSLIANVAEISEGDIFQNLTAAAAGLTSQYVRRELEGTTLSMSEEFTNVTKRVQGIRNLGEKVVNTGYLMMGLYADMPYVAAQNMCQTIIKMADLKIANLECMSKHIVQLTNAIIVLAKNVLSYKDDTLSDLGGVSSILTTALTELARSQRLSGTTVIFDSEAFDRAREALITAARLLSPVKGSVSVLDVAEILTFGSVEQAHVTRENLALVHLVIPSLVVLIEVEAEAAAAQAGVINHLVASLGSVLDSFRQSANTSKVQVQRSRGIAEIVRRVADLRDRVNLAIQRKSIREASSEMLLWVSRVKSMIVVMDQIKDLSLIEGSVEDIGRTAALQAEFDFLLQSLTAITSSDGATVAGIEDMTGLRTKASGLGKGAIRVVGDLDAGRTNKNRMATFHALAATSAQSQTSAIQASITVASQQKVACARFLQVPIDARENFDQLVDSMRQLGLDRAVDLLGTGAFTEFLDSGMESLSYLGTVIKCLTDTMNSLDSVQARRQLAEIRDELVSRQVNQDVAAADSSDQGLTRYVDQLKGQVADIQKNAKTVEAILDDLRKIADAINANVDNASDGLDAFAANLDRLVVGAGGRLASGLEEFSKHPRGGVPLCEAP